MKLMVASVVVDSVFVCEDGDDIKVLGREYLQREVDEGGGLFFDTTLGIAPSRLSLREIEDKKDIPPGWEFGNIWGSEEHFGKSEVTTLCALDLISKEKLTLAERIKSLEEELESLKVQLNGRT